MPLERYLQSDRKSRATSSLILLLVLSGCTTLNAVTLPETKGDTSRNLRLTYDSCENLTELVEYEERESSLAVALPLVFDTLASSFKSYVERKSSRFTATYAVRATLDSFTPNKCLRVQRLSADGKGSLLDLLLEIKSRGPYSAELSPTYLKIAAFAASTSPVDGKNSATVSVSAALSFVNGPPATASTLLTELASPIASAAYTIGISPTNIMSSQVSGLIPKVGNRAVNVAVSITEVGRGADIFGDALSGFDDNADALKSMLGLDG